jgi:hypothetical protein
MQASRQFNGKQTEGKNMPRLVVLMPLFHKAGELKYQERLDFMLRTYLDKEDIIKQANLNIRTWSDFDNAKYSLKS